MFFGYRYSFQIPACARLKKEIYLVYDTTFVVAAAEFFLLLLNYIFCADIIRYIESNDHCGYPFKRIVRARGISSVCVRISIGLACLTHEYE